MAKEMTVWEHYEKVLHDGLVENNLIGSKWRIKYNGIEDKGYQFIRVRFDVYRARAKKPICSITAVVDSFRGRRSEIEIDEGDVLWLYNLADKYHNEIIDQNWSILSNKDI